MNNSPKFTYLFIMSVAISIVISGCAPNDRNLMPIPIESILKKYPTEKPTKPFLNLTSVKEVTYVKPSQVLTFSCEIISIRPKLLSSTCADFAVYIRDIEWKHWGASGAVGKGIYSSNNCIPNCTEGEVDQTPVKIKLEGLFTDGKRYFLRYLTFTDYNKLTQNRLRSGTWDLAEFYLQTQD